MSLGIVKAARKKIHPAEDIYLRALKNSPAFTHMGNISDSDRETRKLKLNFKAGDVLFVVDNEDSHWWQAVRLDSIKDGIFIH